MSFTDDLRERFFKLSQTYPGFEEVLTQSLFGLVAMEHMLWYSRPGRAKSTVARAIFGLFENAPVFNKQLTKDTMPDAIFGNPIAEELMKSGREIYNLEGGIVTSTFAYLDEFFDANDFVLRSMLNVLNERIFESKDMGTVQSPLHSVIVTTNYLREREATQAVLDRILCKAILPGITDVTDCMQAGQTYLGYPGKRLKFGKLDYNELRELALHVQCPEDQGGIAISPGMRLLHVLLVQEFQRRRTQAALDKWHAANSDAAEEPTEEELGVPDISPRTLVKLHDMSRAAAALNGRNEVHAADNRALGYGIYIVGDSSGDSLIWHQLCDEFLQFGRTGLKSLEDLGQIADGIGQIKCEKSQVTAGQMAIGGKLIEVTSLNLRRVIDTVTFNRHPVLSLAKKELSEELATLASTATVGGFNLLKGWE
jgi:MoxR-like ATPase